MVGFKAAMDRILPLPRTDDGRPSNGNGIVQAITSLLPVAKPKRAGKCARSAGSD